MAPSAGEDPAGTPGPGGGSPGAGPGGEKKVFVKSDESWKAEAQREKDRLQEKAARAEEARRALPPPSFLSFVSDLGVQAMLALGLMEIKGAGGPKRDLPAAAYTIDLLGILQEKTRGNLAPEEKVHLDDLLTNLRIAYVKGAQEENAKGAPIVEPRKKIIT